jgi:hypothetical protein
MSTTHPSSPEFRILLADDDETIRVLLEENVARHIFLILCPGRLCARSGRPVMSGRAPSPFRSGGSLGRCEFH